MLRELAQRLGLTRGARFAPDQIEIVIATKNSAGWIGTLLEEYRRLAIRPFILLDGFGEDETEQILRRKRARYKKLYPEFPRVEAMIQEIPRHIQANWALRLDDDEFPSGQLLKWIETHLAQAQAPVLGVPRRWLRLGTGGHCEYSNHQVLRWLDDRMDIQWRLFRPDQVEYTTDIHSAGFLVPRGELLPESAYLVHFDWILRSMEQRAKKLDGYDRQKPGAGSSFRDLYLWETADSAVHGFKRMETTEFDRLAGRLRLRAQIDQQHPDSQAERVR